MVEKQIDRVFAAQLDMSSFFSRRSQGTYGKMRALQGVVSKLDSFATDVSTFTAQLVHYIAAQVPNDQHDARIAAVEEQSLAFERGDDINADAVESIDNGLRALKRP